MRANCLAGLMVVLGLNFLAFAQTVEAYLLLHGVAKERLKCTGHGDTKPVADNATEEGRKKNRRVELHNLD